MRMSMDEKRIRILVESHLEGSDLFLVDLHLTTGKLTVFVDGPGGISLAQCTAIGRFLNETLGVDGFTETHEVEVSSPGPAHPLRDARQFAAHLGRRLRVVLDTGAEVRGRLVQADAAGFELQPAGDKGKKNAGPSRRFAFGEFREARIEYEL